MTYQHTTRAPRSMPRSSTPQQLTRDPLLTVSSTDYPGAAVIHVAGEIDLGTAPTLSTYLSTQWENSNRPPVLVLHLADVSFMSCAGLRALLATQDEATAHETELRLVNCPPGDAVQACDRGRVPPALLQLADQIRGHPSGCC